MPRADRYCLLVCPATDTDWWDPAARHHPAGTYFYYFKAHGVTIHTQHTGVIEVLRDK